MTFATSFRLMCITAGLAIAVLCCGRTVAAAEAISIEEFVGKHDNWPRLAGTTWTLEGRYALLGAKTLKFVKCDLDFILGDDLPRIPTTTNVVQVTGVLEKPRDRLEFRVTAVQARPADMETLRYKRSLIDPNEAQGWYGVAEWAQRRSRFYNDSQLMAEALNLYGEGIEAEQRKLAADDYAGTLALTKKAVGLGLAERQTDYLRHAGYRRQFDATRKSLKPDYTLLLADLANFLPESTKPQPNVSAELAASYQQDPQGSYRLAEAPDRIRMNRLFYVEVVRAHAEASLQPEGRNGFEVARLLETQAPELADQAKGYREQYLQWQIGRIETLTRQELFEFAKRCEDLQQPDQALDAKRKWLLAREPKLRGDGARGLVELGEDWYSFLNDEPGAAKYYMDAFSANPDYVPASDWLTAHRYVFERGKWIKESEIAGVMDATDRAVRDGRLQVGMSEQAVQATMGANPTHTYRFASSGRIVDMWVFEEARIVVRLERQKKDAQGTVVAIDPVVNKAERRKKKPAAAKADD